MRTDPADELQRILGANNPPVNGALNFFHVNLAVLADQWQDLAPADPLAWNEALRITALEHSQRMLAAGVQSHQLPGEPALDVRVTNAGYGDWSDLSENVFAHVLNPFYAHAAFAIDWGPGPDGLLNPPIHRLNIMNPDFREIGIGLVGPVSNSEVGPFLVTEDFGNRFDIGDPFLLGVVYEDKNENGFYDVREGLEGVTVEFRGAGTTWSAPTWTAGGYQFQVPAGEYKVTFSGGGLPSPIVEMVKVDNGNTKVDASFIPPPPVVSFALSSSSAKESLLTPARLVVTLSRPAFKTVTVDFAVTGGMATGGGVDFIRADGTRTFLPGQTKKTIPIRLVDDGRDEPDETVEVSLLNPSNAVLGANVVHVFTILDNDPPPRVNFQVAASGGSEGSGTVLLAVSLSRLSGKSITVDFAAVGGTAQDHLDYSLTLGPLTFAPGEKTQFIELTLRDDRDIEPSETVVVSLLNPVNVNFGIRRQHVFTILDNDSLAV